MKLPRAIPIAIGALALLTTTALLVIQIVISTKATSDGIPAIAAAALEALALVSVGWIYATYLTATIGPRSGLRFYLEIGTGTICCASAAAASIATLVSLGQPRALALNRSKLPDQIVIACAAVFGISFSCQAVFIGMHYLIAGGGDGSVSEDEKHRLALVNVKSIPYSQTTAQVPRSVRSMSITTYASTVGGRSRSNTVNSIKSSIAQTVRPVSSKSKLAPPQFGDRTVRRAISLDSTLRSNLLRPEDALATHTRTTTSRAASTGSRSTSPRSSVRSRDSSRQSLLVLRLTAGHPPRRSSSNKSAMSSKFPDRCAAAAAVAPFPRAGVFARAHPPTRARRTSIRSSDPTLPSHRRPQLPARW